MVARYESFGLRFMWISKIISVQKFIKNKQHLRNRIIDSCKIIQIDIEADGGHFQHLI